MNEADKLYIAYSNKIRAALERFDVLITELKRNREGLDNYLYNKKKEVQFAKYFLILGWVIAALVILLVIYIEIKMAQGVPYSPGLKWVFVICSPPLLIFIFFMFLKYFRARKALDSFMDTKAIENPQNGYVNNYYYKSQRYSKCIKILEGRRDEYQSILDRLAQGEMISEKEIVKIDNMSNKIYNIPELGYTYHEF